MKKITSSLFAIALAFTGVISGFAPLAGSPMTQSIGLEWDRADTIAVRYNLYRGTNSGSYDSMTVLGPATSANTTWIATATTYYFVVKAVSALGVESLPSNEVAYSPPVSPAPVTLRIVATNWPAFQNGQK